MLLIYPPQLQLLQHRQHEAQVAKLAHMQEFVDKFRFNAKRASLVQSRIKAINKEKEEVVEEVAEEAPPPPLPCCAEERKKSEVKEETMAGALLTVPPTELMSRFPPTKLAVRAAEIAGGEEKEAPETDEEKGEEGVYLLHVERWEERLY